MGEQRKKMVIDLFAGPGAEPGGLIQEMVPSGALTISVLRGRITPRAAWFRLELDGTLKAIETFLTQDREGIVIIPLPAGAAA